MSSAKKNRPKKTMSLYEWQRQNQKHPNKPVDPTTVSTSKKSTSAQSSAASKSNQPSGKIRRWDKFHNPYHFVPAKKGGSIDDLSITAFDARKLDHVTHDRYVDDTLSGRVICRLTAETPFFVGDEQTKKDSEDSPAKVSPFRVDGDKPAIPATSLRGLISNIAEAASNSALRVLEASNYSHKKGTSHDYFRAISSELLPFNPDRKTITIAEQLFGFVEQDFSPDKSQLKDRQARGLASRLRFSHALFTHWEKDKDNGFNYYLDPVPLKILASPKPPSPALYFKNSNGRGGYISKEQLRPQRHHPQGRKFYLHQKKEGIPWKTRHLDDKRCKQKVEITPVKDGAVFYFHIDFDNLSEIELGLLLYSLSPSNTFRHKLGMGKPIGLGTVKIEPVGLFTINRKERYSVKTGEDIFAENRQRYHHGWLKNKENDEILKDLYKQEAQDYDKGLKQIDCAKLQQDFAEKMDKDIQKALELLGNPDNVKLDVHYPQLHGKDIENENFKWFMKNDDKDNRNKQCLKPIELTRLS